MPHLLQICNVGQILGGTAACAWTITHALPNFRHSVVFLSPISGETRAVFRHARIHRWETVTSDAVASLEPGVILLHNTPASRCSSPLPVFTLQYAHSKIAHAPAHQTVYCSRWLARQCSAPDGRALTQPVPIAPFPEDPLPETRALRSRLLIGRLCTPSPRKWPDSLVDLYRRLAALHPEVDWEFVGCPDSLEPRLAHACAGRAAFFPASWAARAHLHRWDALLYHHPTLTESFGRTCAEALRAGCLPIVDARGGFLEQLDSEPSRPAGFACRSFDDFAAAIETIQCPATRWKMSRTAKAHGDDRFSLAAFAREFGSLLPAGAPGRI